MKNNFRKVMCFGTFDLVHLGHLHYFQQARKYGNHLIVVIARDKTKQDQKKETIFNEQERLKLVQSLEMVDEAVLGYPGNHLTIIMEKKPDVICLGYDHEIKEKELEEKLRRLGLYSEIKRMKSYKPELMKSSKIKNFIFNC